MGRPTRLTPELQERIVAAIRAGNYLEDAARAHGIGVGTLHEWIARGNGTHNTRAANRLYAAFAEAVAQARAEADVTDVSLLRRAALGGQVVERVTRTLPDGTREVVEKIAPGDWRAAAWRLERMNAPRFGRRQAIEVTGADGGPLAVEHGDPSDPAVVARRLQDYLAGVRDGAEQAAVAAQDGERPALPAGESGG